MKRNPTFPHEQRDKDEPRRKHGNDIELQLKWAEASATIIFEYNKNSDNIGSDDSNHSETRVVF